MNKFLAFGVGLLLLVGVVSGNVGGGGLGGTSGGGGGGAATNAVNVWTANQSFTTNVIVNPNNAAGRLIHGTNDYDSTYEIAVIPNTVSKTNVRLGLDNLGRVGNAELVLGNIGAGRHGRLFYNANTKVSGFEYYNESGTGELQLWNNTGGTLTMGTGGATRFTVSSSGLTLGDSSSYAITANASTMAIPNGLNIGSGVLNLPVLSSTMISNSGAGFYTTGQIIASNIVSQTTDGIAYLNSGTNTSMRIIANGSAGTILTEGLFTTRTNTLTASLPVLNTIYTNNAQRLNLNVSYGAVAGSGNYVWTVSGSQTNTIGMHVSTSTTTNTVSGWIQPNALYMFSNFSGTAPTLIPGQWNEIRF